jgi:hypothetical protein
MVAYTLAVVRLGNFRTTTLRAWSEDEMRDIVGRLARREEPDPKRVQRRADTLLPEERKGGSDDPSAQAEEILAESDARTEDRDLPPGKPVEHRHSEDTVEPTD